MSALASLAAIVLFVAVAVTSSATSAFLAGYGFLFIAFLVPVVFWFFAVVFGIRSPLGWFFGICGSVVPAILVYRVFFRSSKISGDTFENFGTIQVIGIVGLVVSAAMAVWVSFNLYDEYFRQCPHCLSRIKRKASRCRHCTAEVDPLPVPVSQKSG